MFRVAHVSLTILGMLVCPALCMEGAGDDAALHAAPDLCCAGHHSCPTPREGDGCRDDARPGDRNAPEDPCKTHGCICTGAVETRPEEPLAAEHEAPVLVQPAALNQDSPSLATGRAWTRDEGPQTAPVFLASGRAIRIALESLLL